MAKNQIIPDVLLISDPNADVDDLVSFVTLAALADKGLLTMCGVITTVGNFLTRMRRARFAKGSFMTLGYPLLPVSVGSEYEIHDEKHDNFFGSCERALELEKQGISVLENPMDVMQKALAETQDKSMVIVVNAQMLDVINFIHNMSEKSFKKIKKIIIMGAAKPELDVGGFLIPDEKSYNNAVCMTAACELYRFAQEKGIGLLFVPKETIYEVQFGHDFYDFIASIDNNLAKCIVDTNKLFLENLWNSVRNGDYSHFDIRRFAKIFMGKDYKLSRREIKGRDNFEEIWPKIRYFNLYDAISVVAASDEVFKIYGHFEKIIEEQEAFVARIDDVDGFRKYMTDLIIEKLKACSKK